MTAYLVAILAAETKLSPTLPIVRIDHISMVLGLLGEEV
jgi:hypothetical protein